MKKSKPLSYSDKSAHVSFESIQNEQEIKVPTSIDFQKIMVNLDIT